MLAALAALTLATTAHAAPQPITRLGEESGIALAGENVLVTRTQGARLTVFSVPVAGGAGRPVFTFDAPPGLRPRPRLAASAQRVALTVTVGEVDDIEAVQAFTGPPSGPLVALGPLTPLSDNPGWVFPFGHQVDGDRVFTTEARGSLEHLAVVARDPDPHDVAFATPFDALYATFAGDLVAHAAQAPGQGDDEIGRRLVVRDWRTGAIRTSADLPDPIEGIALRPDGRVAATTTESEIYEVRPGGKPRRLARSGGPLAYAGERIVFSRQDALRVIEPSGRIRAFGVPTEEFGGFITDERRVLWVANHCLLVADAGAPAAAAPARGRCPRSELQLDDGQSNPHLGRTIGVVLHCVAAPRRCEGTVRLRSRDLATDREYIHSRRQRISIPAGRTQRVQIRLTEPGYRSLRRLVAAERGSLVLVDTRTDDGDRPRGGKALLVLPRGAN